MVSRELETHGTVYQPSSSSSSILPPSIINHGLLTQDQFLQLLRRAKVRSCQHGYYGYYPHTHNQG